MSCVSRTAIRPILFVASLLALALLLVLPGALSPVRGQMSPPDVPTGAALFETQTPTPTPAPAALEPATTTVQLAPYNDASVDSGGMWTADTNLGGWSKLAVGSQQGGVFRSYLRFGIDVLPPDLLITDARLVLTPVQTGSQALNVTATMVVQDWNEATITWNQQPLTTLFAGYASWNPNQPANPLAIDVTEAARTWYACGAGYNDGLQLSADGAADWVAFGSRKSANPPLLEVTYEASSVPLDCVTAATTTGSQTPSQPGPSTSGAQIGSVNPNASIASATPGAVGVGAAAAARTPEATAVPSGSGAQSGSSSAGGTTPTPSATVAVASATPRSSTAQPTAAATGSSGAGAGAATAVATASP
jgi:hypothetical protein